MPVLLLYTRALQILQVPQIKVQICNLNENHQKIKKVEIRKNFICLKGLFLSYLNILWRSCCNIQPAAALFKKKKIGKWELPFEIILCPRLEEDRDVAVHTINEWLLSQSQLFCPIFTSCPCSQGGVLSVLGSLGMMFWLAMTPHNSETEKKRLAILAGFAFLTGKGMMLWACYK